MIMEREVLLTWKQDATFETVSGVNGIDYYDPTNSARRAAIRAHVRRWVLRKQVLCRRADADAPHGRR